MLIDSARSPSELRDLVGQRAAGAPIEHVLGWAQFGGLRIEVDRGVFVPRPRSELLVQLAADLVTPGAVVVDLCCGSGAVGSVLAAAHPDLEVHAADADAAAVACARRNLSGRGQVHQGDLYAALPADLRSRVGVMAVNAPYVPSGELALMPREARLHEPRGALDGGSDGLELVRRVIDGAPAWLAPGGTLLVETSEYQAPAAAEAMSEAGLTPRVARSEALDSTVVAGAR